jgi:hypothetical protein
MPLDPLLVLAALAVEGCVGYPAKLHRWLPHPVVGLGRIIEALEVRWNGANGIDRKQRPEAAATRNRRRRPKRRCGSGMAGARSCEDGR